MGSAVLSQSVHHGGTEGRRRGWRMEDGNGSCSARPSIFHSPSSSSPCTPCLRGELFSRGRETAAREEARVSQDERTAGGPIPPGCVQIEVHVAELKQLFNAMDP